MMKARMLKLSALQTVADLFRAPVVATALQPSLSQPWNIYTETDLRANRSTTFPYLYMIDHDAVDLILRTPVVLLQFSSPLRHFSLDLGGSNFAKAASLDLHCIGGSRGHSEDIASYIAEHLRAITILDYNNPITPGVTPALDVRTVPIGQAKPAAYYPTLQIMQIDPFIAQGPLKVKDSLRFQGMLTGAQILSFRFLTAF